MGIPIVEVSLPMTGECGVAKCQAGRRDDVATIPVLEVLPCYRDRQKVSIAECKMVCMRYE